MLNFRTVYLYSISLHSILYLFSPCYWFLIFCSLSAFLKWMLRSLILRIYSFLIQTFKANFSLGTVLAVFHKFVMSLFSYHSFFKCANSLCDFILFSSHLEMHGLISNTWDNFRQSFLLFISSLIPLC